MISKLASKFQETGAFIETEWSTLESFLKRNEYSGTGLVDFFFPVRLIKSLWKPDLRLKLIPSSTNCCCCCRCCCCCCCCCCRWRTYVDHLMTSRSSICRQHMLPFTSSSSTSSSQMSTFDVIPWLEPMMIIHLLALLNKTYPRHFWWYFLASRTGAGVQGGSTPSIGSWNNTK